MAYSHNSKNFIDVPEGVFICASDWRAYVKTNQAGKEHRVVVGRFDPQSGKMEPNDEFKAWFEKSYNELYTHRRTFPTILHTGLYAATLGIGYKTGLYSILCKDFGVSTANAIMDFAIYSLLWRKDVAELYTQVMKNEMLFSDVCYSDSWYSELFDKRIKETQIQKFKSDWLDKCIELGATECWGCVDGSNDDYAAEDSSLSEKGHAKSKKNVQIAGFTWAVCANGAYQGMPLTYFVYPGGTVDGKSFQEVINFFKKIPGFLGFILDHGYPSKPVIDAIRDNHYDFVVMLKSNENGYKEALAKCADDIYWNVEFCISSDGKLFGECCLVKLFDTDSNVTN